MRNNGKRPRPIRAEDRSIRSMVGQSPLPNHLLPADMRKYDLNDWREDQHRYQIKTRVDRHGNGAESGWIKRLHEGNGVGQLPGSRGLKPLPMDLVPVDLRPRTVQEYTRGPQGALIPSGSLVQGGMSTLDKYLQQISDDTRILSSTVAIERGLIARLISVPTTPVLIADAQFLRGYIFLNPATTVGLTAASTLLASATFTGGEVSASLGVANFLSQHFMLNVTAVTGVGTLEIFAQTLDPTTLTFIDVPGPLFSVASADVPIGVYATPAEFGVATDMRVRVVVTGATDFTLSLGTVLKNGLAGTSSGVNQTIFIGSAGVTTTTGFPILEGQSERFYLRENTKLFAVADSTLELRVFEL